MLLIFDRSRVFQSATLLPGQGHRNMSHSFLSPMLPTQLDARRLSQMAHKLGGLNLSPAKVDFFAQRLSKRLKERGIAEYRVYCDYLESPAGTSEHKAFIEALTTHTTAFFREQQHYDWLASKGWLMLTENDAGLTRPLEIWSAAASTGAELYSTIMSFLEFGVARNVNARVDGIGTDISRRILHKATQAVYSRSEIKSLSEARRRRFLLQAKDGSGVYRVAPEVRRLTKWKYANLTDLKQDGPRASDLILLRNVLIYFDHETQTRAIAKLCDRLRPGGFLLTGHSETIAQLPQTMTQVGSSIYRKDLH